MRLNSIESVDKVGKTSRYYGSERPFVLVPREAGETEAQWSIRFARKLGVRRVLEIGDDKLPEEIRAIVRPVASSGPLQLFEIQAESSR